MSVQLLCAQCLSASPRFKCGTCKAIRYCSELCQKAHWTRHKPECHQGNGAALQRLDSSTKRIAEWITNSTALNAYMHGLARLVMDTTGMLVGVTRIAGTMQQPELHCVTVPTSNELHDSATGSRAVGHEVFSLCAVGTDLYNVITARVLYISALGKCTDVERTAPTLRTFLTHATDADKPASVEVVGHSFVVCALDNGEYQVKYNDEYVAYARHQ